MRATEELHANAMISDATWATLSKRLDDRQLIELPVLVGQYQGVAYYRIPCGCAPRRQPRAEGALAESAS